MPSLFDGKAFFREEETRTKVNLWNTYSKEGERENKYTKRCISADAFNAVLNSNRKSNFVNSNAEKENNNWRLNIAISIAMEIVSFFSLFSFECNYYAFVYLSTACTKQEKKRNETSDVEIKVNYNFGPLAHKHTHLQITHNNGKYIKQIEEETRNTDDENG